jgi:hypothetical protein
MMVFCNEIEVSVRYIYILQNNSCSEMTDLFEIKCEELCLTISNNGHCEFY